MFPTITSSQFERDVPCFHHFASAKSGNFGSGQRLQFASGQFEGKLSIGNRLLEMKNFVLVQDEVLFNSWRDIFTGAEAPFSYPPKIYSFDGRNIFTDSTWKNKLVWHGANHNGNRNMEAFCDAWSSDSMSKMGVASNLMRGKLLDQEKYSCNNEFVVLCVEVTPDNGGRY